MAGDLAAEFEVFELAQRELYDRRGGDWRGRDFAEGEMRNAGLGVL